MAKNHTKEVVSEVDAKFSRLFWAARKEQSRLKDKATAKHPDYKSAAAFAKDHGWNWAKTLLKGSMLNHAGANDKAVRVLAKAEPSIPDRWRGLFHFVHGASLDANGQHDEAIRAYYKALDEPNFDSPGKAWNNLGNALFGKCKHDEAIKAYRNVLDDPNYTTPGIAWNNLGNALAAKGERDEAIKAYHKALDDPKFDAKGDTWNNLGSALAAKGKHKEAIKAYRRALADAKFCEPGDAWNNLGLTFSAMGQHQKAIKAYHKALDDPKLHTPGQVWNNLAVALSANGRHNEAIKAYRKALDDPTLDSPARVWTNLGLTYPKTGKRKQAEDAFKKALAAPDPTGADHTRARLGLRLLRIEPDARSPDDRAIAGKAVAGTQTDEIESGVIDAIRAAGDTQYEKYIAKSDSKRDNTLSILRGWSSAVTLLEGSERRWRGGGYFIRWRGHGIVIDPGFDFLRNFHDAGYHGREINVVVVSHNHPDHNSDLKDIDDLRYELFKRLATTNKSGSQPYVLLWDQDTDGATNFGIEKPRHQHEPVVMSCGFPQPINLQEHEAKIPMRLTPFNVRHGKDVPHAMGMVLELLNDKGIPAIKIGYTGDTAYFSGLHTNLAGCDVLIAHISQPSMEELEDASKLKDVHLGYRGTARLLKECKPKLALIGEFWAGFTDLRISLVKCLCQRSGVKAILPAGLAMHVRLPALEIECTNCAQPCPFSKIKVAPPTDNFGSLAYLCPDCMIG
jgi:Tfp pilus assembly protein PilF/ribonuclease BN (tRNA processing enzyme)